MVAKMLLPLLGGTPAVWNTCMVFFQAALLAGYAYALVASRWAFWQQLAIQLLLLSLAFVSLPIGLSASWLNSVPITSNPSFWLLACLTAVVGLPFFIVSSNGPLLQKWFSSTELISARDPYFLYSASNAGSLMALLAYPVLLEPNFDLRSQSLIWTGVYVALLLLVALCGLALWLLRRKVSSAPLEMTVDLDPIPAPNEKRTAAPTFGRRLRWVLLAFVPSSLMLGVTNYISTDVASVPLLWVIPLALYLLTLVIAFARRQIISLGLLALILPGATIVFLLVYLLDIDAGPALMISFNLIYFFLAALTCHSQLAADRPSTTYLPEFYLWMSIGGVLGGTFNALLAPVIFNSVTEYPLVILLACLMLPETERRVERQPLWRNLMFPAGILVLSLGLRLLVDRVAPQQLAIVLAVLTVPLVITYAFRKRPVRFALCLGAVLLSSSLITTVRKTTMRAERNFFGVLRVTRNESDTMHTLIHGSTIHGRQYTSADRRCEPLSYFHRQGPFGQVFAAFQASPVVKEVAIVGLGAGATGAYARSNERWTFYEINPAVVDIARDPRYFTYIVDCSPVSFNIVLGDARLKLREAPDASYGLIALDAFSSDAVPVHLLTQQALDLYLSKLAPAGILALHVSNRNLDLTHVVADLARSRNLSCIILDDKPITQIEGKDPAVVVVMARNPADLAILSSNPNARVLMGDDQRALWTDDFSNILSVFRWP